MCSAFDRRSFLCRAAALVPIMHARPLFAMTMDDTPTPGPGPARFARLGLRTAIDLEKMAVFYQQTMDLPAEIRDGSLRVNAGETSIEFTPAAGDAKPYYHFAFNIPHNKLDTAMKWLEPRCALVKLGNGGYVAHFESWNAHAVYFLDPAGNILEFIARHTLKNDAPGDFSPKDILCASEIGVVAPDVVKASDQLCAGANLKRYRPGDENFTAVGDEHGLFIVVRAGRRWFSSDRAAEVFEADAMVRTGAMIAPLQLPDSRFSASSSSKAAPR